MKKLAAIFLAFIMLLMFISCNPANSDNGDKTDTSATPSENTATPGEDYTEGGKFVDYNHESVDKNIKLPSFTFPSKTVVYLSASEVTQPDPLKFNIVRDIYGLTVEGVRVAAADYETKLVSMSMSDEAPDLTHAGNALSLIRLNILAPWDNYLDLDIALWKGLEQSFNNVRVNSHVYTLRERAARWDFCFFNKAMFEEYGLKNPRELLDEGNWNWNTFRDAAKALTIDDNSDGTPEIWGAAISNGLYLVYTTGTEIVTLNPDGTASNNIRSAKVAHAIDFYTNLAIKDSVLYDGSDHKEQFAQGKVAMLWGGLWFASAFPDLIKAGDVGFVPFPKDPDSDKYYIYEYFSMYSLAEGAKNPEGAAALMCSYRYSTFVKDQEALDERNALTIAEQVDANLITNEMSDYMLSEFYENPNYYPVEMTYTTFGIGEFFGDLFFRPLIGEPWSAISEELYPKIQAKIDGLLEQ